MLKRLHTLFWFLLFVVFPLATVPTPLLTLLRGEGAAFPDGVFAEAIIPKLVVFVALWSLGLGLVFWEHREARQARAAHKQNLRPLTFAPLVWLWPFLVVLIASSLFNRTNLNFELPGVHGRVESVLATLLEAAWYSLIFVTYKLVSSRVLPLKTPLKWMAGGALAVALWTLLEAYGVGPLALLGSVLGRNASSGIGASMGHHGFLAAFLGVALVVWSAWRVLNGRVRFTDAGVTGVLSAALVASGGRAGILAAGFCLVGLLGYLPRYKRFRLGALTLGAAAVLAGAVVVVTLPHAEERLARVGAAVEGTDPSLNHRFVFWRIAATAILKRPLVGYGPSSFATVSWRYATPEQADVLLAEFLPPEVAKRAVHIGKIAFYYAPDERTLEVRVMNRYKAHNYFFDLALASGLPALALFIGLMVSCVRALYRSKHPVALAACLGLVTYLVYGMAYFSVIMVDPLVWALVGIGLGCAAREPLALAERVTRRRKVRGLRHV